jgi:hypothetical protein
MEKSEIYLKYINLQFLMGQLKGYELFGDSNYFTKCIKYIENYTPPDNVYTLNNTIDSCVIYINNMKKQNNMFSDFNVVYKTYIMEMCILRKDAIQNF